MAVRVSLLLAGAAVFAAPLVAQTNIQLEDAQRAAWGRPGSTTYRVTGTDGADNVTYSGGRLVNARFGPVLVAEGKVRNPGHVSAGRIGAFYLKRTPSGYARARAFQSAVTTGSFGEAGEWSVSTAFASNPVIYSEGGFTGQGYTCSTTTLTELTPAGPAEVASFQSYSGDMNAKGRDTTGRIANIVRDRGFDVVYTGAKPGKVRFVRHGARFVADGPLPIQKC